MTASEPIDVLYEDNHLLAVNKPPGLPTMGTAPDRPTLLSLAKEYVKGRYGKPGNVYLGIVSRLDAPVTGVVLLARTSKAAQRLTEQFRSKAVEKTYWAIVEGIIEPASGECVDWIGEDPRHRRMWIVGPSMPGAKEARLSYRTLRTFDINSPEARSFAALRMTSGHVSLLEIALETGRKHQIRLQLARRGHPIWGDRKYGSPQIWPGGIALHARRLVVLHPVKREPLTLEAPLPAAWAAFGVQTWAG